MCSENDIKATENKEVETLPQPQVKQEEPKVETTSTKQEFSREEWHRLIREAEEKRDYQRKLTSGSQGSTVKDRVDAIHRASSKDRDLNRTSSTLRRGDSANFSRHDSARGLDVPTAAYSEVKAF
eukprot:GHVO01009584.1.p1 GENE.GHVO01009584.1~~GHVO01009584.1.p1  ORF type:complete len:125 (+),score=7.33 GHVO01009584.1:173-547(+)